MFLAVLAMASRRLLLGTGAWAALQIPRAAPAETAAAAPHSALVPSAERQFDAPARLYAAVAHRRASQWRDDERAAIDALVEEVASMRAPWRQSQLRGEWRLAYLQPGPDGAGVDRRVPFPELPWNDSYQVFGDGTVVNVGELLGSALVVRVGGSLIEGDPQSFTSPKRFRAVIRHGGLCAGGGRGAGGWCAPLPISGVGLFDGLYLDDRLRIGQNINGGGARIVQVRVG